GFWTVPNPDPPVSVPGTYASSAWIGLDGHDPASRSLPQLGTAHWVTTNASLAADRQLYAWWQWWVRGAPHNGHVVIRRVPVAHGDKIFSQLQMVNRTTASLFIMNLTSHIAFPVWFRIHPHQPQNPGPNPLHPHIEGRTAEWILERPQHLNSHENYQLANYGQ